MFKQVIHTLAIVLFLFVSHDSNAQQLSMPESMPEWSLHTQDGELVTSDSFAGKPLILHFWATWCPHCKHLQPGLDQLAKDYEDKGLQVLGVSFNESVGAQPQSELERRNLSLQTLVEGDALALETFAIFGTPTTVFIAPDGRVLGATMQSDPDDPQWTKVADYLVSLTP